MEQILEGSVRSFPELKAQGGEDATTILHVPMRPQGPRGQGHATLRRFVKFLGDFPAAP